MQGLNKEVKNVSEEVCKCQKVLEGCDGGGDDLIEEVLDGLDERLRLMDSLLEQRCDSIRDRLQGHTTFQVCRGDFLRVSSTLSTPYQEMLLHHNIRANQFPVCKYKPLNAWEVGRACIIQIFLYTFA